MASPFSVLAFVQVPPFIGFPDLLGCFDKRSQQLEEDQSHFAKNLSLVCHVESVCVVGFNCIPVEPGGWSEQAL